MGDLNRIQNSSAVQITDDSSQVVALSTGPIGSEVGLVVRNIPFGTQTVAGTVAVSNTAAAVMTTAPTGTEAGVVTRNVPSGTQPISGTVTLSSQTVTLSSQTVTVGNNPTVTIGAATVTQPISGTVTLSSQTVTLSSQTVTIGNNPTVTIGATSITQPVSGTVTTAALTTTTGTITNATTSGSVIATLTLSPGQGAAVVTIHGTYSVSGTTNTLSFQASDDGSTWYNIEGVASDNSSSVGTMTLTSNTSQAFLLSGQGGAWKNLRVLYATSTTLTSGTVTVNMNVSTGTSVKSVLVQGDVASNIVNSGNPLQCGGIVQNAAQIATLVNASRGGMMIDKQGRVVTAQYSGRDNVLVATDSATTTASRTLLAGQTGVFADISSLVISNGSSSAELISISDGTNTYKWAMPANTNVSLAFPVPIKATTTAAPWTWSITLAASTIYIMAVFVKTL